MSNPPRWKRPLRLALVGLVGFELLYLLAANLILSTRFLREEINASPDKVTLDYARAYSVLPGRVHVTDLSVRFEDRNVEFLLRLDAARVDINLLDLLQLKFHATQVQATGVSWRQGIRVDDAHGQEERLAAFPVIAGFPRPALRPPQPISPPAPNLTGDGVWTIEIEDVDAEVKELWVMEYDYQGAGRARGSFELQPMQHVWVGPATLVLEGGVLTAGEHLVSSHFALRADVKVERFDIQAFPGLSVFRPISASVQIDAPLADLSLARLYLPELKTSGPGTLHADLQLVEGRLTPLTLVELELPMLAARQDDVGFRGKASAYVSIDAITQKPTAHATVDGAVTTAFEGSPLIANVSGVTAQVLLTTNDLVQWPALVHLRANVAEARVANASALKVAAARTVPIVVPQILGDGPLVASGAIYLTPAQTLILLHRAELGGAALHGAAVSGGSKAGWYGAAAGELAKVIIGLRLDNSRIGVQPLVGDGWLEAELAKVGIDPKLAEPQPGHVSGRRSEN